MIASTLRSRLFTTIDDVGGWCPVQGEGTIRFRDKEYRFYFRARGQRWQFGVGKTDDEAVSVAVETEDGFRREQEWGERAFDAGYMPEEVAREIIYACAEELLQEVPQ